MKSISRTSGALLGLLALLAVPALSSAQSEQSDWVMPRTIDGHPDLQGVYENNTLTPEERPDAYAEQEFFTDEDIALLEQRAREIIASGEDALFGDGTIRAVISGEINSYDPTTGNYDSQWMVDRKVHRRTSQIIDPPDGKYPPLTLEAVAAERELTEHRRLHPADSWTDRPLGERCLTFGAPRLNTGYNSYWQIVQTRDTVAIIQEMAHDVRIVPIVEKPHLTGSVALWHGDSRGWWDGDTLVVETTNYSEASSTSPGTQRKVNTERLTRISDEQILYHFTSHDPGAFTAPYTRELMLDFTEDKIYEYACHEGNYGMYNMLSGHRAQEMAAESEP